MDPDLHPTPTALLARTRAVHAIRTAADADLIQLAAAWADAHPDPDDQPPAPAPRTPAPRTPAPLGPDWVADHTEGLSAEAADHDPLIPAMDWAAGAAFAAAIGMSTQAGEGLIRDALTLRHRLPKVWARVVALEVPVWRARRIAQAVHTRPADVSASLDDHVAAVAERVGVVTLDRLVDEAMLRLHAEERELAQLRSLRRHLRTVCTRPRSTTPASPRRPCARTGKTCTTSTPPCPRSPTGWSPATPGSRSRPAGPAPSASSPTPPRPPPCSPAPPRTAPTSPRPRRGIHLVVHTTHDTLNPTHPGGGNEIARLETPTGGAGRAVLAQQVAAWCGQPGARTSRSRR